MALIQRPVKTLGNREYAQEKAANPNEPIKSAEVDGDLDTIYALVNGQLDTANLKASANIVGTQLAPGANILGSQLSPSANIQGSQLTPGSIPPAALTVGAAVRHQTSALTTAGTLTTTEGTMCTLPSLTTSGGTVLVVGFWDAVLAQLGTISGTVTTRVRRDGTSIWGMTLPLQGNTTTVPIPPPLILETPPAGAHIYTITGQTSTAGFTLQVSGGGAYWVLEFA